MSLSPSFCGNLCSRKFELPRPPRVTRVLQVPTTLTSATQDPNIFDWATAGGGTGFTGFSGPTGGLTLQVNAQVSDDGSLVYEIFEALPALNILTAQLYSNSGGVKTLLQSVPADPTFSGNDLGSVDSGGASPDFSLFSVIDDDGGSNLRARIYASSDFTTPVGSVTFNDFGGGGSANGGFFSADNNYLFMNYISGNTGVGPIFKVLSVPGLSTVATTPTLGFASPVRPISIGLKTYIPSGYLGSTGFTNPVPVPPFGFQIFIYDESVNSLTSVNSPPMYAGPVIDATLLSNGKIRIAAGLRNIASLVGFTGPAAPYPSIPRTNLIAGSFDTNNIQIFDFDPRTGSLVQVYHTTVSGGAAVVNWLPSSNGTVLAIVHSLTARLNSTDFTTNVGSDASDWLVLDTDVYGSITGSREVGPLQVIPPAVLYGQISRNSQWLVYGATVQTPFGFFSIPSLGQNTMDTAGPNPNGFNDALLYQIQPPVEAKI